MEPIKSIIKKPSTAAQRFGPEIPTKKRKSVSFAPSPEKPSKRQSLVKYIPAPRSKIPIKKSSRFIPSPRYPFSTLQWPRNHQSISKQSFQVKSNETFELPSQLIEPLDFDKDWFTSMHTYISCTATPTHVIGINQNKIKRQCEGIEGLDERLLTGEVDIIFHPDHEYEPVCGTCWTMNKKGKPEIQPKDNPDIDEPELPGSWPKELAEPIPHTHIYNIEYTGCKRENSLKYPGRHSLRLVKGTCEYGGNGTMCRCTRTNNKESEDEETKSIQPVKTKILMPLFAGCPACEGKDLQMLVKTNERLNKKR